MSYTLSANVSSKSGSKASSVFPLAASGLNAAEFDSSAVFVEVPI